MKKKKYNPKSPFIIHTWFERNRSNIWVEDANGENIAEWWDEEVQEMFEDGFFNPEDYNSIIKYLISIGVIKNKSYNYKVD
jgi:hypothetical protein